MRKLSIIVLMLVLFTSLIYADLSPISNSTIDCSDSRYLFCDDFSDSLFDTTKWIQSNFPCTEAGGFMTCPTTLSWAQASQLRFNDMYKVLNRTLFNFTVEFKINSSTVVGGNAFAIGLEENNTLANAHDYMIGSFTGTDGLIRATMYGVAQDTICQYPSNTPRIGTMYLNGTTKVHNTCYDKQGGTLGNINYTEGQPLQDNTGFYINSYNFANSLDYVIIWKGGINDSPYKIPSNFNINAINNNTLLPIYIFNATINNTLYQTTNGSIVANILTNDSSLWDISLQSYDSKNTTYLNFNVSSNMAAYINLNTYLLNITLRNAVTNLLINNFNLTINSSSFISSINTTNGSAFFYLPSNYNYTLSFLSSAYFSSVNTFQLNKSNFDYNLSLTPITYLLNISAYKNYDNSRINNFNITINSSFANYFISTINGSIFFVLPSNQNYTTRIDSENYTSQSNLIFLDRSPYLYNFSLFFSSWTGVSSCNSSINATTLNISILDEDYNIPLTADITGNIYVTDNLFINTNSSFNFSGVNTFKVCIYPISSTLYSDIYIEYKPTNGYKERYYIQNMSLTNTTQYVNIYNFNTTSTTTTLEGKIVHEQNYLNYIGVIGKLRRFFPATNEWRLVQMDKSDEFGKTYFYIHEKDTLYDLIFDYNYAQIYHTNEMKFLCDITTGVCQITFPLRDDSANAVNTHNEIDWWSEYDNDTGLITTSWNDPTGLTHGVRVEIVKLTPYGINVLYNQSTASASGSLAYNATGQTGSLQVRAYSTASPERMDFIKTIEMMAQKLWQIIDSSSSLANGKMEAGFWAFGLALTSVGFALFSPIAALMALMLSMIIIFVLGLVNWLSIGILVLFGIIIIVFLMKARN